MSPLLVSFICSTEDNLLGKDISVLILTFTLSFCENTFTEKKIVKKNNDINFIVKILIMIVQNKIILIKIAKLYFSMKRLLYLTFTLFLCLNLSAQTKTSKTEDGWATKKDVLFYFGDKQQNVPMDNGIKFNSMSYVFGEFPIFFERRITPNVSAEIAAGPTFYNVARELQMENNVFAGKDQKVSFMGEVNGKYYFFENLFVGLQVKYKQEEATYYEFNPLSIDHTNTLTRTALNFRFIVGQQVLGYFLPSGLAESKLQIGFRKDRLIYSDGITTFPEEKIPLKFSIAFASKFGLSF
jgi:hypothetical protein